jgi:hypothetical protein
MYAAKRKPEAEMDQAAKRPRHEIDKEIKIVDSIANQYRKQIAYCEQQLARDPDMQDIYGPLIEKAKKSLERLRDDKLSMQALLDNP